MSSEPTFRETMLIIIITIPLGLFILCGTYALWFKAQVGTRDNLAGEQRGNREFYLRRDRERAYYTMAVDRALTEAKARRREVEERGHDRR